ncbi:hypothetical protein MAR_027680, partial [Mya arenaria]
MHVVRRSHRYRAGLSTDLVIEQMSMCSVETFGGLTRGTQVDEAQRAQRILSRPVTNLSQHKESGKSRKRIDNDDIQKMMAFLVDINPLLISKKAQVITKNDSASEQVVGDELQIEPQFLFQRFTVFSHRTVVVDDLQNFLAYELCTYSPALFETAQLLRGGGFGLSKSLIGQEAEPTGSCITTHTTTLCLMDTGLDHQQWTIRTKANRETHSRR